MNRLEKLKKVEDDLWKLMQRSGSRQYASLARQYRETLKEIEEIESSEPNNDEIAEILSARKNTGKAGAVR